MATVVFDKARQRAMTGLLDWTGDTYKVMLCDDTYVPDASDEFVDDGAAAKELTDASYLANGTSGRVTLANKSATIASNRSEARADNVTYSALDVDTAGFVVVYQHVNDDTDSLVVCAIDIADVLATGIDLVLKWNSAASNGAVFKI